MNSHHSPCRLDPNFRQSAANKVQTPLALLPFVSPIIPSRPPIFHFLHVAIFRKLLQLFSVAMVVVIIGLGLLWMKNPDSISPQAWQHVSSIWSGQTDLLANRTPGELIRYFKRRLEGHPNLEMLAKPPLHWLQTHYERVVPPGPLPHLGKGQQPSPLPALSYGVTGQPMEVKPDGVPVETLLDVHTQDLTVDSVDSLLKATAQARPGQTITIAPGTYVLKSPINTKAAGNQFQPIILRAAQPGQVTLEVDTEVAVRVAHPYWMFENLRMRGICKDHLNCEHAFHIFGAAQNTVVRNNYLEDFNAHIKINGAYRQWPDYGLIQYNTLTNNSRRETHVPVTQVDLVGANHWRVLDNLVSNFVKGDGNMVSYGLFMKGASFGGRIERNLVICTPQDVSQPGVRVGISFGGGGTGKPYCRDLQCEKEHTAGMAANNIVAHCNDFGIDVNHSSAILIANNTLINTAGIDVRGDTASARLYGNLLDGRIRQRDGGRIKQELNLIAHLPDVFDQADSLTMKWLNPPENIPSLTLVPTDFAGSQRLDGTPPGASLDSPMPASK